MRKYKCIKDFKISASNLIMKNDILISAEYDDTIFNSTFEIYKIIHENILIEHPDCFELINE